MGKLIALSLELLCWVYWYPTFHKMYKKLYSWNCMARK